jgi:hypothetical protein
MKSKNLNFRYLLVLGILTTIIAVVDLVAPDSTIFLFESSFSMVFMLVIGAFYLISFIFIKIDNLVGKSLALVALVFNIGYYIFALGIYISKNQPISQGAFGLIICFVIAIWLVRYSYIIFKSLSDKKTLWLIATICLIPLLIISLVINTIQVDKINFDNTYFSQKVLENVQFYSLNVLYADKVVNKTLQSGQITVFDANMLGENFENQASEFQNLSDIDDISTSGIGNNGAAAGIPDTFSIYVATYMLHRTADDFDTVTDNPKDVIYLNSEQKSKFEAIKTIMDAWSLIVKKDVKGIAENDEGASYNNNYFGNTVNNSYWKNLINDTVHYVYKNNLSDGTVNNFLNP